MVGKIDSTHELNYENFPGNIYLLKAAVYKTVIRPVLMYGSETWALRKAEQNVLERTEMRILTWMMGIKRIEKIRKEEIWAGVANISEKIREATLI